MINVNIKTDKIIKLIAKEKRAQSQVNKLPNFMESPFSINNSIKFIGNCQSPL